PDIHIHCHMLPSALPASSVTPRRLTMRVSTTPIIIIPSCVRTTGPDSREITRSSCRIDAIRTSPNEERGKFIVPGTRLVNHAVVFVSRCGARRMWLRRSRARPQVAAHGERGVVQRLRRGATARYGQALRLARRRPVVHRATARLLRGDRPHGRGGPPQSLAEGTRWLSCARAEERRIRGLPG